MRTNSQFWNGLVRVIVATGLVAGPTVRLARGEDRPRSESNSETPSQDSKDAESRSWIERVTRFRPAAVLQRDNAKVREAFRDVVSKPRSYTVRVYANAEQVALGIIVDADGLILTKASELSGTITAKLSDGRRFPTEIVASRGDLDLALLRIEASDLPIVTWATGDAPEVGNWLATPAHEEIPSAIGVVSGTPRRVGAPRAMLGVYLEDQDPRVVSVQEGSGADKAGIKPSDLITHVNGKEVTTRKALVATLDRHRVGDKIELLVKRGDQELSVSATMVDRAAGPERAQFQNALGSKLSDRRSGFPLVIPHDSILRPNECGGPLVNLDGETVGINIARAGRVASYALPASIVLPAIAELKSTITATPASLLESVDNR